jgi:hypothetical protein
MGKPERVVKCSLRSAAGLVFVSDILSQSFEPMVNTKKGAGQAPGNRLQLVRAAERTNREKKEQQCESNGCGDEPVGYVAGPGAQGYVEPDDAEKCKDSAGDLEEKLLKGAPETVETSLARRGCRRSGGGRHKCILPQNPE